MKRMLYFTLVFGFIATHVSAQDEWYLKTSWIQNGATPGHTFTAAIGIAASTNGLIAVCDTSDEKVSLFNRDGSFLRAWVYPTGYPFLCNFGPDGLLYVTAPTLTPSIHVYDPSQPSRVESFGKTDGHYYAIAVDTNLHTYAYNFDDDVIDVFDSGRNFIRTIGSGGSGVGQFSHLRSINFGPHGLVHTFDANNDRHQIFTKAGALVRSIEAPTSSHYSSALSPDGRIFMLEAFSRVARFDHDYNRQFPNLSVALPNSTSQTQGIAIDHRGDIWITHRSTILHYERTFRTLGGSSTNAIPTTIVKKIAMRPGAGVMDIDFHVLDPDSPLVTVAALACVDGGTSLNQILPLNTLVDSTDSKLGQPIASGTNHRISWNVAADWNVDFGELEIELLTNDGRALIDLHLITIPANNGAPELTINRVPLGHADILPAWRWLLATGHPEIKLEAGVIKSSTAPFNTYASDTDTTVDGRDWLFPQLGYREANFTERARAREAREGNTSAPVIQDEPLQDTQPSRKPTKVNPFGFETGISTGYWVVPQP